MWPLFSHCETLQNSLTLRGALTHVALPTSCTFYCPCYQYAINVKCKLYRNVHDDLTSSKILTTRDTRRSAAVHYHQCSPKRDVCNKQFSQTRFFHDNPWLLVNSLAFPRQMLNSLTFSAFPEKRPPCVLDALLSLKSTINQSSFIPVYIDYILGPSMKKVRIMRLNAVETSLLRYSQVMYLGDVTLPYPELTPMLVAQWNGCRNYIAVSCSEGLALGLELRARSLGLDLEAKDLALSFKMELSSSLLDCTLINASMWMYKPWNKLTSYVHKRFRNYFTPQRKFIKIFVVYKPPEYTHSHRLILWLSCSLATAWARYPSPQFWSWSQDQKRSWSWIRVVLVHNLHRLLAVFYGHPME